MAKSGNGGGKYSPKARMFVDSYGNQQWVRGETHEERLKTIESYEGPIALAIRKKMRDEISRAIGDTKRR